MPRASRLWLVPVVLSSICGMVNVQDRNVPWNLSWIDITDAYIHGRYLT